MPELPSNAQNFPVLVEFQNPVIVPIAHVDELIGSDHNAPRRADVFPLRDEFSVGVEDLHPAQRIHFDHHVPLIVGGPQVPFQIEAEAVRPREGAVAPGADDVACLAELDNGMLSAMENEHMFLRVDSYAGCLLKRPTGGQPGPIGVNQVWQSRPLGLSQRAGANRGDGPDGGE
ncbi:MAG: hypothetical protein EXQ57_06890 [Bryobacterales bacterium]|nr:hypothetical protein [Bryobacterales bacterium]